MDGGLDCCARADVVRVRLGFSDPSKLATEHYNGETGEEGWLRYHVWCNERALDVAEQRVVIMDLANLSKWHLAPGALASLQRMVGLDRRHYPGTVKAYLVLNPPSAVRALFLSALPKLSNACLVEVVAPREPELTVFQGAAMLARHEDQYLSKLDWEERRDVELKAEYARKKAEGNKAQ